MKKMTIKLCCAVLIGLLAIVPISMAKNKKTVSLAEASQAVRLKTKGKILSARTIHSDGHATHKIQVLTPSGRVKTIKVPVNQSNYSTRNNALPQRQQPSNRNYQYNPQDVNRSNLRDRPMHNSRLNTQRQNSNPRSRTPVNNGTSTRERTDNK